MCASFSSVLGRRSNLLLGIAAAFAVCIASAGQTATSLNAGTGATGPNPTILENQRPGSILWQWWRDPSIVDRADDISQQIKGYASATSVNKGQTITFHVTVNPAPQKFRIRFYRMGWYQGRGGRQMSITPWSEGVTQPKCPVAGKTGLIECNWPTSYALRVPTEWTSGIFLALLINQNGYANYAPFVVRDDKRQAKFVYQQPVTTYQAYNNYPNDSQTGKSLYPSNSFGARTISGGKQAVKVSFDRPYRDNGSGQYLDWESYFVRWVERQGYDITYTTDVDTHINRGRLLRARAVLSVGHDEYWTKEMYDAFVAARKAGVNLGFFGANAVYWQIRMEPSSRGTSNRVVVCYKNSALDPVKGAATTSRFRDAPLKRAEQALVGVQFTNVIYGSSGGQYQPFVVTNPTNWVYRGSGFRSGDTVAGIVGYETDRVVAGYPMPTARKGTYETLSRSKYATSPGGDDAKRSSDNTDFSESTIYQAPSGAWVFAAGTIGWSRGLDNWNDINYADRRLQRTTANILNRFRKTE